MKAIVDLNGQLTWTDVPTPSAGRGEVRIRVHTTAVNRADLSQRAGRYPPPPGASPILGLECSGVISALGEGVEHWSVGDEVCALLAGGGYAEEVVVPAEQLLPVPSGMSLHDAAGVPEVFTTAWLNLMHEAQMKAGDHVLLHAGASGVGTAAIQICGVVGSRCFVTVGSADKIAAAIALGADGGHNRHDGPFADTVRDWAPDGVDIILDPVGPAYLAENQSILATDGRLVLIGLLSGRSTELDLGRMLIKRQRFIGSTLRSRSPSNKGVILADMQATLWPHFASGRLRPVLHSTLPIEEAEAAHALVASNVTTGKVLLQVQ